MFLVSSDNIVVSRLKIGAIIGVILRNQRHVFAYGAKERNGSEAPDSNTVFEIGSNTKTFTAVILADMHLQGDVNLEDNVEIYHPAEKVTIPSSDGRGIVKAKAVGPVRYEQYDIIFNRWTAAKPGHRCDRIVQQ